MVYVGEGRAGASGISIGSRALISIEPPIMTPACAYFAALINAAVAVGDSPISPAVWVTSALPGAIGAITKTRAIIRTMRRGLLPPPPPSGMVTKTSTSSSLSVVVAHALRSTGSPL